MPEHLLSFLRVEVEELKGAVLLQRSIKIPQSTVHLEREELELFPRSKRACNR